MLPPAEAIALLAAYLCEPDRAVLKLLYALNWQPVLQYLGMGSASQQPAAVLLDQDVGQRAVGRPEPAAAGGGQEGARKAWATQILLLVVPVTVMRAASGLPSWMKSFVSETGGPKWQKDLSLELQCWTSCPSSARETAKAVTLGPLACQSESARGCWPEFHKHPPSSYLSCSMQWY